MLLLVGKVLFGVSNFHERSTDNVASTTSVIPFDQEELKQILDLIDALKGKIICVKPTLGTLTAGSDGTEELFPHANCVVGKGT